MPATTYLRAGEYMKPTSNATLNQLLTDVRARTGEDWRLAERRYPVKRFLRRSRQRLAYELYIKIDVIDGHDGAADLARALLGPMVDGEFQIINFYRDHEWTINHENSAEHVAAYLYGILAGLHWRASSRTDRGLASSHG